MSENAFILSLPAELLLIIFQLAGEVPKHNGHNSGVRFLWEQSSVEIISQVCVAWRSVSQVAPTLWVNLVFDEKKSLEWLYTRLRRSEKCLIMLTLDLEYLGKDDECDMDTLRAIMNILLPHFYRWQGLSIFANNNLIEEVLELMVCRGVATELTHLYFHAPVSMKPNWSKKSWSSSFSTRFPHLQSLGWDSPRTSLLSAIHSVNMLHLLELYIAFSAASTFHAHLSDWMLALANATNLHSLTLHFSSSVLGFTLPVSGPKIIVLPMLTTFELFCIDPAIANMVVAHISLPMLTELRLSLVQHDFSQCFANRDIPFFQSLRSVRTMRIQGLIILSIAFLHRFVKEMEDLEELYIDGISGVDFWLRELTENAKGREGEIYFPKMTALTITVERQSKCHGNDLLNRFTARRRRVGYPLNSSRVIGS